MGGIGGHGSYVTPSPFSIAVPVTPTSEVTPSPSGTAMNTPDSATASCGENDEFSITTSQAPEIEECYQAADGTFDGVDGQIYSVSGTLASEQTMVIPFTDSNDQVSPLVQHVVHAADLRPHNRRKWLYGYHGNSVFGNVFRFGFCLGESLGRRYSEIVLLYGSVLIGTHTQVTVEVS